MGNSKWFITIFMSCLSWIAVAQFNNVLVSDTGQPEEVSICMNPKNTQQLVAGANIAFYYYSNDGGLTWHSGNLSSTYGVWGDPCLLVDTAQNYYFIHLANPGASGNWIDRIVCQKSTDGGKTYNNGTFTGLNNPKNQDKAWGTIDFTNSPYKNNIYVCWTQFDSYGSSSGQDSSNIMFSRSADGGQTWSPAKRLDSVAGDCLDGDNTDEGAVPCIGPNGEVYVAWAGPEGLVFDKSTDGGNTWLSHEEFVTSIPGGWDYAISGLDRCNGLPATACDLSNGPYHGTIYINWSDQRNGSTDTDVWLVKSTDGGQSWSAPIRVNDDPPGKQQFMTWMTIDQSTGYVYCVFYDRRNYSSGDSTDVYMARSTDGGNTFTNFKISTSPFVPDANSFFGDYIDIAAHNNVIRPAWMRMDNDKLSVWTAIIDGNALGIPSNEEKYSPVVLEQNRPNPFNKTTWMTYKLPSGSSVSLYVYNIYGTKEATLFENRWMDAGEHEYILNVHEHHLAPGVYYYSLVTDETRITRKMVLY